MNKTLFSIVLSCVLLSVTACQNAKQSLNVNEVTTVTNRALVWQQQAYPHMNDQRIWKAEGDLSWENAIYLAATARWANFTNNDSLRNWCQLLADTNHYQVSTIHGMYFADDLVIGSMYAQLFRHSGDSAVVQPMYRRLRYIVEHPLPTPWPAYNPGDMFTKGHWSWCDALYMAPAVFAEYAQLFNDADLLNYLDEEIHGCADMLYSPSDSLFFRDSRYKEMLEDNGQPVFWGRGNAWVLGGLARTIPFLPDTMDTSWYKELYRQMALRVIRAQHPDGFWRASMLDPDSYPNKEMSCTTLFAFAIWWGLNEGLLTEEEALEPAVKAWKSIVNCVHEDGMLGSVQPVGENPKAITSDMTEVYGPAAMALAAEQIIRYLQK